MKDYISYIKEGFDYEGNISLSKNFLDFLEEYKSPISDYLLKINNPNGKYYVDFLRHDSTSINMAGNQIKTYKFIQKVLKNTELKDNEILFFTNMIHLYLNKDYVNNEYTLYFFINEDFEEIDIKLYDNSGNEETDQVLFTLNFLKRYFNRHYYEIVKVEYLENLLPLHDGVPCIVIPDNAEQVFNIMNIFKNEGINNNTIRYITNMLRADRYNI